MINNMLYLPLSPLRIGIDLDGVLVNHTQSWVDKLYEMTGHRPKGWDASKDPNCWDWMVPYGYTQKQVEEFYQYSNKNGEFWFDMCPLPSLVDLEAVNDAIDKESVHFITNRPMEVYKHSSNWVRRHFGDRPYSVMHARHKGPIAYGLQLHCLIDDRPNNLTEVLEYCGLNCMPFLLNKPWNQHEKVSPYIIRIDSIKEGLDKLYKKVVQCQ